MTRIWRVVLSATLALASPVAAETEDGLYGAPIPSDAVFLRRLGATDTTLDIFGRSFLAGDLPEATYVAISAAALEGAAPGGHYTIVGADGVPQIIDEPARADRSKVYLFLLNLDAAAARLVVAGGGPTVIDDTAAGQIAERGVNPLAVTLTVEADGQSQDFDVVLRRGVNLTFVVSGGDIHLIENRFGPVIETEVAAN